MKFFTPMAGQLLETQQTPLSIIQLVQNIKKKHRVEITTKKEKNKKDGSTTPDVYWGQEGCQGLIYVPTRYRWKRLDNHN